MQDIYQGVLWGLTTVKGRERKHNWAEGEVEKWCSPTKAAVNLMETLGAKMVLEEYLTFFFPNTIFYRSRIHPRSCIAFNCHVSLVFFYLEQLMVSPFFHDLDVFEVNGTITLQNVCQFVFV